MKDEMKTKKQLIDELITLRKRVAESEISKDKQESHDDLLLKSGERFRYFVENANDIVYSLAPDGIFTYVSPNWTEILGHDIHEVAGQSFESFVHPDDIPLCRAFLELVIATGKKQAGVEYRVRHKIGTWRWHTSNASPVRDADGNIISYMGIARDITERKQAEEALLENEKKFRQLIMNAPAAIFEVDFKNRCFISLNDIIPVLAGYSREELIKMDPWELFTEASRKTYFERMRLMKEGRDVPASQEYGLRRKDGSILWVNMNIDYTIEDGLPVRARIVAHDITARKQAEEALLESERLYKTLAESSFAAVFIVQDGKFRFINTSAIVYAGYSAEELVGSSSDMIVHPDDKELVKSKSREMLAGRSNQALEFRMVTKQNDVRWISQTVTPIQYGGRPAILGNAIDVTELKWAEEALKDSEQRLHDIIDFLPDATYAIDLEGKVIAWNRAMEAMTGVKALDMLGKGDNEYAIPLYGMRRPLLINLVFSSNKEIEDKYSFVKKEGDVLIAEANVLLGGGSRTLWGIARPLCDSKGNIVGAIESIRDISERKRAEEARYHHEKIKGVLEMAGAICHEMNQPMQIISGYSEMLLMNISENDPIHTKLDTINKQIHRMGTITRKLMKIKDYDTQDYAGFSRIIDLNKSSGKGTE